MESDGRLVGSMENSFMAGRVLWPAVACGCRVVFGVVLLASRVLRISFSSPRVVVFVFFVVGSRFLETHHSNNGLYKLPDN